uniref:Acetylserotonin O-methyltransferase n=1 Tax=Pelusios castaneus TaxID=367368 RepID=A0A8C8RUL6_9SAUR
MQSVLDRETEIERCLLQFGHKLLDLIKRAKQAFRIVSGFDAQDFNCFFVCLFVMFTACELGVFDLLLESEGPLSSDAIAERLGASTNGMERLLDACVGLKLLGVEIKSEGAFYRNTELSSLYLTKSRGQTLCHLYKIPVLTHFAMKSEEEMIKFMQFLNAFWSICGKDVIAAFDLSPSFMIWEPMGGGVGGLAKECISLYPNSTVTIYDLPKIVQVAKEHFIPPEECRITFHEGDFFKDPVPEADLYILARVLHDWADDKCLQLLTKVHKSCKPGGGVLIVETLLNEDKTGPLEAQLFSVIMLVQTEGKERTPTEHSKLLTAAGFREIQVKKTGKFFDVVLGRK